MKFSSNILGKAITATNGELAWKKEDVFEAIDELIQNNYAILGGEIWAIANKNNVRFPMMTLASGESVAGGIKGKDGEYSCYTWTSEKRIDEAWNDFIIRTKEETIEAIKGLDIEDLVSVDYTAIYYNLTVIDNADYVKLGR